MSFVFLKLFQKLKWKQYSQILYMFGKIPLWSCLVLFAGIFICFSYFKKNYKFNFTSDPSVQIVYFFLTQSLHTVFLEICLFLLGCLICWHVTVRSILSWFFNTSVILIVIYPISLLILFIWVPSLFFLVSLAKGLSILSFQKASSWFHWSFYCFLSLFCKFLLYFLLFPSFCWFWVLFIFLFF